MIKVIGHWSLVIGIFFALACEASASRQHKESWYADALAENLAARTEVRMRDGTRCDVLGTHAIEVEFAGKWCEAVGQSLNYAAHTGRPGAIALILEHPNDERFLARLQALIRFHRLPLKVIILRPFSADGLSFQFPSGFKSKPDFHSPNPDLPK